MKVIFVIQGEGRGHLTQALALKQMLLHEGHEVVKVLVGKSKNRVIPEFFQNKIGTPVEVFDSPNFLPSKDNRKFNLLRSLAYNTLLVPNYLSSIHLIRKNIQKSGADIIINFYEEDVEFRMWENHAESRIVAAIENADDTYYYRKENQAYEEENDSIVAASSLVVPARRVWQG